jgi:hypothetical protein
MPESTVDESLAFAILPEQITLAKEVRATRLSIEAGEKISPDTIATEDLVFRVMTWDHVPVAKKQPRKSAKKKTAKDILLFDESDDEDFADLEDKTTKAEVDDMVHVKVNFPPFQHYKLDESSNFRCVGKSHWINGVENGEFSKDHGNITNKLARMYIMLCEKYAMKYNWRGYTYIDEMKGQAILQLSQIGLQFDESKSENPFAYYTAAVTNSFTRILNLEKKNHNIRDDLLEIAGLTPSLTRQTQAEFAVETARQAELYKNFKLPKSEEPDVDEEDGA